MALETRREASTIPTYSLTGDLLSYLRCGLQYRYQNGSALPPARPVQLWFGEFIHGVMEMAFRLWAERNIPLPWPATTIDWDDRVNGLGLPDHDIGEIGRRVEAVLALQGKIPRNKAARMTAYQRAEEAINVVGPHLFPLVAFAEEPLAGSRLLPATGPSRRRADRYGVTGVADVLTHVTLSQVPTTNIIRAAVADVFQSRGQTLPPEFEVIVDYKGAARPDVGHAHSDYWQQHDWQIQMYAWLRGRKPNALPVVAGILFYVNELLPSTTDVVGFRNQIATGRTDVVPVRGSKDAYTIDTAHPGTIAGRLLSQDFRLKRALRVIPITDQSIADAGAAFDGVVAEIETRIVQEIDTGDIGGAWDPTCQDKSTCDACDSRYFCSSPAGKGPRHAIAMPPVP